MTKSSLKSNFILFPCAIIWGSSFVAQDKAADVLGTFTINAIRSFIGTAILFACCFVMSKINKRPIFPADKKECKKTLLYGLFCGIFLCIAVNLQTFGLALYPSDPDFPSAGRAGFLTALYVIFVPICGLFFKKKVGANVFLAAAIAVVGLGLLCLKDGFGGLYFGDLIVMLCAVSFTAQILVVDAAVEKIDGVLLSAMQFAVCGVLSLILVPFFEAPTLSAVNDCIFPLLYLGIFSSGIAYTGQIMGQKYATNPTVASIIMSLESVFAVITGFIFGAKMVPQEIAGCVVMFMAIVLSQLEPKKKNA